MTGAGHFIGDTTFLLELPISQRHDEIAVAIRDHQVVVVAGETGSARPPSCPRSAWSWNGDDESGHLKGATYVLRTRPDSGLTNGKLGIWLFLASEVMLFGALFSTYIILRVGSVEWPHGELNVWLGMANTFILIGSSVTMVMAWASLKLHDFGSIACICSRPSCCPASSW